MGEIVRFVSRDERERIRLIQQARAIYDNIFPSAEALNDRKPETAISRSVGNTPTLDGFPIKS